MSENFLGNSFLILQEMLHRFAQDFLCCKEEISRKTFEGWHENNVAEI